MGAANGRRRGSVSRSNDDRADHVPVDEDGVQVSGGSGEASDEAMGARRRESRWTQYPVWALLLFFSVLQQPGKTTFDTKLDLTENVAGFMGRALYSWNPMSGMGELQNQAYGYLFPHGLFFWLGDVVGLPGWITQRLWSALLLVLAYEGARRLFIAIDRERARAWLPLLAGLAYAFAPRMLGLSGSLTGEVHPTAMLPWVVLPLVLALSGRFSALHGAAWSGVAVACMGAVNATEVLLSLIMPGLLVLFSCGTSVGRRLMGWWLLALALSTFWWTSSLVVQGKFSPPFLDYIETAATTTQPLGWTNVVRGANHWLSFLQLGGEPWWDGAHQLSTGPLLIVLTGGVAAISLFGLFHPSMPWRVPFAVAALVAAFLLTLGHLHTFGSPLAGTYQSLLDSVLSPFRNVHKLDPVMRLPMALGFAHAVGMASVAVKQGFVAQGWARSATAASTALMVVAGTLLVGSARPLFTQDLRNPGFDQIPETWRDAAAYLGRSTEGRRTWIVPGSSHGIQEWGWTIDEPIQPVAESDWVTRSQVPLAPGSTIRFLDSLEERIQDGTGSPHLADALARSGISHVLARRDINTAVTGSPSDARVEAALSRSPGLREVAMFGSEKNGDPTLVIYKVERTVPLLQAVPTDSLVTLAGGPEDILTAMEAGVLGPTEITVNSAEKEWNDSPDVVGDGYHKRERNFGRVVDAVSHTMTAEEKYRTSRRVHDYGGVGDSQRVVAEYESVKVVRASSSKAYADAADQIRPEFSPYAAIDGEESTYWLSSPWEHPEKQWLEVQFDEPTDLRSLRLLAVVDGMFGTPMRRVRIKVGDRSYERDVDPETGEVVLDLPGGPVERVRVSSIDVFGDSRYGQVGIRELSFEGVDTDRTFVVPDVDATPSSTFSFRTRPHRRPCVELDGGPECDISTARPSEEEQGLNRTFVVGEEASYRLDGTVLARSTWSSTANVDPSKGAVRAEATSVNGWDPAAAGQRAMDGDTSTAWVAAEGEIFPSLEVSWDERRTIDRIALTGTSTTGILPTRAVLVAGDERRTVDLVDGVAEFEKIRTDEVSVSFPMALDGRGVPEGPLAIAELELRGITDLVADWDPTTEVRTKCGDGPALRIDSEKYRTRVVGTQSDVVQGNPMSFEVCDLDVLRLGPGRHSLVSASTDEYAVNSVVIRSLQGRVVTQSEAVAGRALTVTEWEPTRRVIEVGPGQASVLRIPENANLGWRALLDGEELKTLRLDSWQQGYVLPADASGQVVLEYLPDASYRTRMWLGGVMIVGVYALAAVLSLRGVARTRREDVSARIPLWLLRGTWPVRAGAMLVGYLLGGLPVLVGIALGNVLGRRGNRAGLTAAAATMLAAVLQGWSAWRGDGVSVDAADWAAGLAVGVWMVALLEPVLRRRNTHAR
ncbi:alpha-(1-_3)-arabinofuranosyltransferase domain-containing protein [Nocardioides yefusunii]|uniref:Alpha-(1->3)-arabinofuranosyltransferase family protein n=1 Tax=Nocardioides yefusunii TaxID=2500546 RepID=A0ABW1QUP4_9ACTN|nr:alpha-(1->3)-arabinofuranosyltransferase family protein [Nocardioides yefusunii]